MVKVLVTGATGFVGKEVVKVLTGAGHDVIATDIHVQYPMKMYYLDVTYLPEIKRLFRTFKPDVVVHLAALVAGKPSIENPHPYFRVNVLGTLNVLEAMRECGIKKLVYVSSWSTYGELPENMLPITEWTPQYPKNPYGTSKVSAEFIVRNYSELYGIKTVILRPTMIYGPNQPEKNVIQQLVDSMATGETFELYGTGCFSKDTEILTENGFLLLEQIVNKKQKIKIATLNSKGELEYQSPIRFWKVYAKNLIHFDCGKIDTMVTPKHNMFVRRQQNEGFCSSNSNIGFQFVKAHEVPYSAEVKRDFVWNGIERIHFRLPSVYRIIKTPITKKRNFAVEKKIKILPFRILMDNWLKFFGIWLADGHTSKYSYEVGISQTKKENIKTIQKIIRNIGFNTWYCGHCFRVRNKQLWSYLKQFGKAESKFIPKEIKQLDKRQLQILLKYIMLGDGSPNLRHGWTYSTISKCLADDVQEIALKSGYVVTMGQRKQNNGKTLYILSISTAQKTPILISHGKGSIKPVKYNEYAYCVEVPNHVIYVRRNGKSLWCGNSHTRECLYVTDMAKAVQASIEHLYGRFFDSCDWDIFVIGTGKPWKIKYIARLAQKISDFELKLIPNSKWAFSQRSNITKAIKRLGWFPKVNIKEGLKRCLEARKTTVMEK